MGITERNMGTVNVKQTQQELPHLLDRVAAGETIAIARRGHVVAKLVPPTRRLARLPSLKQFRATIRRKGSSLRSTVIQGRAEARA